MFLSLAKSNPNQAYVDACIELSVAPVVSSRNGDTRELHPAILHMRSPEQRLITCYGRPVNPAFSLAEVLWILQGRNDVAMLQHYNSNIGNYSDNGTTFNAAYGHRLRNYFNDDASEVHDQLEDLIMGLRRNPESRQAVMAIWHPYLDASFNGYDAGHRRNNQDELVEFREPHPNVTADRACNLVSNALIRNGRLDWTQTMRSNDIIWGTPNNFMQWMHIQEYVARRLGVAVGSYTHIANSLHVYRPHWGEIERIRYFNLYEQTGRRSHSPMAVESAALEEVYLFEEQHRLYGQKLVDAPLGDIEFNSRSQVGTYWLAVEHVFAAWSAHKAHNDALALALCQQNPDPVLGAAQARYFWWWRWHKLPGATVGLPRLIGSTWGNKVGDWIMAGSSSDKT